MLYGNQVIQNEIISKVHEFETNYNKKVIFGSMVGSISKGVERYDSDYDTRFLYFDQTKQGVVRWDQKKENIKEDQIHYCYIPTKEYGYVDGMTYRSRYGDFELEDKSFFYDKIAFWEFTSFINFLTNPKLDDKVSVGLYHIVGWTFNSPFCWDPYGIKSKITFLLDKMFIPEYEIQYYRNYIIKNKKKDNVMIREYLYSAYYALAIEYCMEYFRFPPVYFKSLLAMCNDNKLRNAIINLEQEYYSVIDDELRKNKNYQRKMGDFILAKSDNYIIDHFIDKILIKSEHYDKGNLENSNENYVDSIINIVLDSLQRPIVKDVNDK